MAAYERRDAAYRRAKEEGYRSRAAYKLTELDAQFKLLRPGMRVVDLGCWPGGWLQIIARRIGRAGRLVGVDVVPTKELPADNATLIFADVTDETLAERVRAALGGPADLVASDLAPKLSGIATTDAARHAELVHAATRLAIACLKPDGTFLVKLFQDSESQALLSELRRRFRSVRTCKPKSTRRGSAEIYAIAREPA